MLKCDCCNNLIEENELAYHYEPHGELMPNTCHCGGDFMEAQQCKICGNWFILDELTNGFCDDCLSEQATLENAEQYASEPAEINAFLIALLGTRKINQILSEYVKNNCIFFDNYVAKNFCLEDKEVFAEWLERERL